MERQVVIKQILNGLNEDLQGEYAAGIQYLQHSSMLKGVEYAYIINEIVNHAKTEFNHAKIINNLIVYLGGIPTIEVSKREISQDNIEMLKEDLQGEYEGLTRYLDRIRQFEAIELYDSSQKIREIIQQEQQHIMDLRIALGIRNKLN